MAKLRKQKTIEERLEKPKSDVRKLNNILKSLKELERGGNLVEDELIEVADKLRVVRDIYKTKIKLEQLIYMSKEAS